MAKTLDVYFKEKLIGELTQDNQGEMHFAYSQNWLDEPSAIAISQSLPLQQKLFNRRECGAFFEGILPEDSTRKLIAKNLGISANNDFSMLEKIGGECAGALSFLAHEEKLQIDQANYHAVSENELAALLAELPLRPLLAGDQDIRLSLAGVQDKLAVYIQDGKTFIPLNSAPSTHILKPDFGHYEGLIYNEAFCLDLANKIGLSTASAEIKNAGEIEYLLIKRYDRIYTKENKIERIHQEDFCQALNISSRNKYQNEGGPSLYSSFELLRSVSARPVIDLDRLLNGVIFNYLIGNCDAHGKNFSLLYNKELQLAPLYDLICTIYYPELSHKMAMKLGSNYDIKKITMQDFEKFASETKLAKSGVRKRIATLQEAILSTLKTLTIRHPIQEKISTLIQQRCSFV